MPTVGHWFKNLSNCLAMEKLTYATKGKIQSFFKIWGRFIKFLESHLPRYVDKISPYITATLEAYEMYLFFKFCLV